MADLATDVLVVGSGAGGAITAAALAAAGRTVTVLEEGPWVDADAVEPFSLDEMVAKYRHHGLAAALGTPAIAYAEGRCVGGSTEINSGLYHRLPDHLADEWRSTYAIEEFSPEALGRYADRVEHDLSVASLPGAPPPSSAALERGATKLGWRNVEFARVFSYDRQGRGTKQTMSRTMLPRAVAAGATIIPDCRVLRLLRHGDRIVGARCRRTHPGGGVERLIVRADHVFVCGGAIHSPALLQRSGIWRNIGNGLKMHPTIKIAARFPHPVDHGDVPTTASPSSRRSWPSAVRPAARATWPWRWPTPGALRRGPGRLGEHLRLLRRHPQRRQGRAAALRACAPRSSPTRSPRPT